MRHYLVEKIVDIIEVDSCRDCPNLWGQDMRNYIHYRCFELDRMGIKYNIRKEDLNCIHEECRLEYYSEEGKKEMLRGEVCRDFTLEELVIIEEMLEYFDKGPGLLTAEEALLNKVRGKKDGICREI